jgi:putative transposase
VSENRAVFPVAAMCRILGVSPSGFYAWAKRAPSGRAQADARLIERIGAIHVTSHGTYGAPRIHAELAAQGIRVGCKRVARLMRHASLEGVSRRRFVTTTVRDGGRRAPDLIERDFSVDAPNILWLADITYVPTWAGFLYLAIVLDAFSRRIVGWSMGTSLRTQLVLDALEMALRKRRPGQVIHHSDQGSQYTSIAFGQRCKKAGVRPSMGSVGDAYDNAMAESFFATLECELIDRNRFKTQAEARSAVFAFIEGFYNSRRRHSALGYLSPIEYERRHSQTASGQPEPAAVLAPLKARPSSAATRGKDSATAGLDRRCARRPTEHAGRDVSGRTKELDEAGGDDVRSTLA